VFATELTKRGVKVITVTVQGNSIANIRGQLLQMFPEVNVAKSGDVEPVDVEPIIVGPEEPPTMGGYPIANKKKTRKKRAKKAIVVDPSAQADVDAALDSATLSLVDCTKSLQAVQRIKDTPVARKCLEEYGVKRLSDLPTDKYQAFIDHCATVVA